MIDQAKWFRIGFTALPLGLVVLGVVSFVIYFLRANDGASALRANADDAGLFHKRIEKADLQAYVKMLAETIGERNLDHYEALQQAATWLESSLGPNMGYRVERQGYSVRGRDCYNIEVQVTGRTKPDEIVVVGAHYDSAPGTPGADDNASGVAALVCLANAFVGSEPARTVRFVGFVNEEPPYFQTPEMGSYVYAQRCRERGEKLVAMLSLESLGFYGDTGDSQDFPPELRGQFPATGDFAAVVGNLESRVLVDAVAERLRSGSGMPVEELAVAADVPGVGWSDHWSFWEFGYEAAMVTDTAAYRNPHYHAATDTSETLDFDRLHKLTVGLQAVISELVEDTGERADPVGKSIKKTR